MMAAEPKHRLHLSIILPVLAGLAIGLILGWWVWPVSWYDTDPSDLRVQHQLAYVSMTADSLAVTGDVTTAEWRLYELMDDDTSWEGVAQLVADASEARRDVGDEAGAQRVVQMAEQLAVPEPAPEVGASTPPITQSAPKMLLYGSAAVLTLAALAMLAWFFGEMSKQRGLNLSPVALVQGIAAALKKGNKVGPRSTGAGQVPRSRKTARAKNRPAAPAPRRFPKAPPEALPRRSDASFLEPAAEADSAPAVSQVVAESVDEVDVEEPAVDAGAATEPIEAETTDVANVDVVEVVADGDDGLEGLLADDSIEDPLDDDSEPAEDDHHDGEPTLPSFEAPVAREVVEPPASVAPPIVEDYEPDALGVFEVEYDHGDDEFDCSFSIESSERDFLGECGVGVADVLLSDESQRVDAFDIWLFDKSDIRTVSKILVSEYVYHDPVLNAKLSAKGELVLAEPGATITLETLSLRVTAMVRSFSYDRDYHIPECCFSHLEVHIVAESSDTIP